MEFRDLGSLQELSGDIVDTVDLAQGQQRSMP
jgi:hypothetical protein